MAYPTLRLCKGGIQVVLRGREYTNSLGMEFVRIEPGRFAMGADARPLTMQVADNKHRLNGDFDEHPRHRVTITKPFYMSAFEVTNQRYEQFDPAHRTLRGKLGFSKEDDEAVVYVSWREAVAFCRWLSEREGLSYRLPTEAEWEYACRAGGSDAFYTGEQLPQSFYKNARESWYPDPSRSTDEEIVPLHVGKTEPNRWGLYDMHGNVEEWCLDWYGPYIESDQADPIGYVDGDFRTTRGGSHSTEIYYLRSANRMAALPDDSSWLIGFRVVMGDMPKTKPLPLPRPQPHQLEVRQGKPPDLETGPDPNQAYFSGPKPFVKVPPGSYGPMYSEHNHAPSIVECPNGDLLAVWFSCMRERGRELTLLASRLRCGNDEWDPACPFWDAPDRNMTGSVLWRDADTLYQFGGISAAATWGNMIIYMRTSHDSGASWSKAEIIVPDHANGQVMPINLVFRAQDGSVVLPCDDGSVTGTKLYTSSDNCKTWVGSKGHIEGIHAGVVQLRDGRLLAFGRRKGGDPRPMPQSISDDMGATWKVSESPFDPVSGGQRPVLMRLRGGPLLFISFAKKMSMTDISGTQRTVSGLFGALSYDEGLTWPVRRLISDDGPGRWVDGGAWTGRFIMSHTFAEPRGYLAATQAVNGLVHLVSSRNHYVFHQKWLETPPPEAQGDDLA